MQVTTQPFHAKHKLPFVHPKVCDAHLNRWFTFPTKITLTTTPRCVPHILTGNMWSTKLQCLRQNKNNANLWQTANLIHIQLPMHAQLFTKLQNRSQWFLRIKPIDMSCSKNENSCKARDSWQNYSRWVPQVQVSSSPKSSKTLKFQDISKLLFHSNLSLTALSSQLLHFSSQLSAASKPSITTRPGTTTKTYTLGGNLPTQTILWASAANLYNKLPFSSNSKAFIVPCQRYSLGLYFRRIPASAFWR